MTHDPAPRAPTFGEALRYWLQLGFISFGGPAGQIALMHREIVEQRRWVSEEQYLHALNLCHLLPGPEAQQLAIWIGWKLHGVRGGLAAGLLFVVPGAPRSEGLSSFRAPSTCSIMMCASVRASCSRRRGRCGRSSRGGSATREGHSARGHASAAPPAIALPT